MGSSLAAHPKAVLLVVGGGPFHFPIIDGQICPDSAVINRPTQAGNGDFRQGCEKTGVKLNLCRKGRQGQIRGKRRQNRQHLAVGKQLPMTQIDILPVGNRPSRPAIQRRQEIQDSPVRLLSENFRQGYPAIFRQIGDFPHIFPGDEVRPLRLGFLKIGLQCRVMPLPPEGNHPIDLPVHVPAIFQGRLG